MEDVLKKLQNPEEKMKSAVAPYAAQKESWSIRNKNKYAQNLFERLINDVPKKGKR